MNVYLLMLHNIHFEFCFCHRRCARCVYVCKCFFFLWQSFSSGCCDRNRRTHNNDRTEEIMKFDVLFIEDDACMLSARLHFFSVHICIEIEKERGRAERMLQPAVCPIHAEHYPGIMKRKLKINKCFECMRRVKQISIK